MTLNTTDLELAPLPPNAQVPALPLAHDGETTLAWLRQVLVEPLQAVVTLAQVLLQDAEAKERPEDFLADIRKMYGSSQALLDFVEAALNVADPNFREGDFDTNLRRVRHDLGNRLNQVGGFCQLLLFREEADFFGAFQEDLDKILELCRTCDQKLLQTRVASVAVVPPPRPAATARVPDWLQTEPGDVLIVDDDASGREVLRRLLKPKGHRIWEAENGLQAIAMMKETAFDVVLLDILMPEMNGFEVLQHLRESSDTSHSGIIVISGLEDTHSVIRCLELGAQDYLSKPIDHLLLQARVNSCLQKRRFQQKMLEQFFPPEVARLMVSKPELLHEGREAEVTMLFCDIRGFSRISETLKTPSKMVEWVSSVMDVLSECVLRHQGVLVDFIGDELLAMWGAPQECPDHANQACLAALDMLAQLPMLNERWVPIIGAVTDLGIGINTGLVHVGNTGTRRKYKYGPLGSTVNLASRVQGATKYVKTKLLITGATRAQLDDQFPVRRLSTIQVVNIDTPVDLYEVVPHNLPNWAHIKHSYEKALEYFETRQLKEAVEVLGSLITQNGAQGPELSLLSRAVEALVESGKWKKVWDLPGK